MRSSQKAAPGMWKRLLGTPRRFFLTFFRPGYVKASLAKRQGQCLRCGACCRLVVKCIFFTERDGAPACRIYGRHPPNCSQFPIDKKDIADRDAVAPDKPCGFSWPDGA